MIRASSVSGMHSLATKLNGGMILYLTESEVSGNTTTLLHS